MPFITSSLSSSLLFPFLPCVFLNYIIPVSTENFLKLKCSLLMSYRANTCAITIQLKKQRPLPNPPAGSPCASLETEPIPLVQVSTKLTPSHLTPLPPLHWPLFPSCHDFLTILASLGASLIFLGQSSRASSPLPHPRIRESRVNSWIRPFHPESSRIPSRLPHYI